MDSILEIRNLSFSFGLKALFQGVGLRLMPLDSYAVWGPSGVGKSTLLKIIAGLISGGGRIGQPLRNPPRGNHRQSGGDRPGTPGDGQTSRWTNPGDPGYTGRRPEGGGGTSPPILENVRQITAESPAIAANVKDISRDVREITGDVKKATPELPDLVHQTRETVEDADQIVTGLQNHWLIQRLISPPRKDGPIGIDGLVKSRRRMAS